MDKVLGSAKNLFGGGAKTPEDLAPSGPTISAPVAVGQDVWVYDADEFQLAKVAEAKPGGGDVVTVTITKTGEKVTAPLVGLFDPSDEQVEDLVQMSGSTPGSKRRAVATHSANRRHALC